MFIALAGQHQIWRHDIASGTTAALSGDGSERNANGSTGVKTSWAQPSGLALSLDGKQLWVADSESSTIRSMALLSGAGKVLAWPKLRTTLCLHALLCYMRRHPAFRVESRASTLVCHGCMQEMLSVWFTRFSPLLHVWAGMCKADQICPCCLDVTTYCQALTVCNRTIMAIC